MIPGDLLLTSSPPCVVSDEAEQRLADHVHWCSSLQAHHSLLWLPPEHQAELPHDRCPGSAHQPSITIQFCNDFAVRHFDFYVNLTEATNQKALLQQQVELIKKQTDQMVEVRPSSSLSFPSFWLCLLFVTFTSFLCFFSPDGLVMVGGPSEHHHY